MPESKHIPEPAASATYAVWVRNPYHDEPRHFIGVEEVVELPDRIDIHYHDGIREQSYGEIVRVRQEIENDDPAERGFELFLLPDGEFSNVADAVALPTGEVKIATADGSQHVAEGRILWLRPEVDRD